MRENNIKEESTTAVAAASFLLNLLIILVVGGCFWLLYTLFNQSNLFGVFFREIALR